MKKLTIITVFLFGIALQCGAVPTQITYQGTLKEKGVPANGTKSMKFEILNGNQSIWTTQMSVPVTNGLFSVILSPTGVDWEHITASLQVTIENQLLTPAEPMTASAYSLVANAVVDGAISPSKVATGYGLVPTGAIMMFTGNCPSGWTRFTALDNRFPMGSDTYGNTGGSSTHNHSIATDGAHSHGGVAGDMSATGTRSVPGGTAFAQDELLQDIGTNSYQIRLTKHSHSITSDGAHNHGGVTGIADSLPPFLSIVYCQK